MSERLRVRNSLGQQQLRLPIAIDIGTAKPWLFDAAARQSDVQFLEIFARNLAQDFYFSYGISTTRSINPS